MRWMIDVALHRWMVGFTIDSGPKNVTTPGPYPWTGLTLYVGPFALGLWIKGNYRFGPKED